MSTQYACESLCFFSRVSGNLALAGVELTFSVRAQRTSGLIDAPAWEPSAQVSPETAESKSFAYSPDGAYFAQALNGRSVHGRPPCCSSLALNQGGDRLLIY